MILTGIELVFYINSNGVGSNTVPFSNAVQVDVGAEYGNEASTHNVTLPRTALTRIQMLTSGCWASWVNATFLQHDLPLWIINCSPPYEHIRVGSSNYTRSCA